MQRRALIRFGQTYKKQGLWLLCYLRCIIFLILHDHRNHVPGINIWWLDRPNSVNHAVGSCFHVAFTCFPATTRFIAIACGAMLDHY